MDSTFARDATPQEHAACATEPIAVPGAVQPHGVLLALHGEALTIGQASRSAGAVLGHEAQQLLGRTLGDAFGGALVEAVRAGVVGFLGAPDQPFTFSWRAPRAGAAFTGHVHLADGKVLLELEPRAGEEREGEPLELCARASREVRSEATAEGKGQRVCEWLRTFAGYDRVMVYRFHSDWHGEVIAEACAEGMVPFLGLHYPASDIPEQARALYRSAPIRAIVDVNYRPSELVPLRDPQTGAPLDLSMSALRSVSPVHLEYLRNMGVGATLVASLLREGELWGLISCHHRTPRAVGRSTRLVVGWLAQDLSTQLALVEESRVRRYSAHLKQCRDDIIDSLRRGAPLSQLLQGRALLSFLGATGAEGAALIDGSTVTTGGATPSPERILEISAGLSAPDGYGTSDVFSTDCLSAHLPIAARDTATASGLSMFRSNAAVPITLMWFRSEWRHWVEWGGNPNKAAQVEADGRLSPRKSFDAWRETVKRRSAPWRPEEVESTRELRAMLDIKLRRRAEAALRESEARFRTLFEAHASVMWMIDPATGTILDANPAAARFYGYPREVLTTMNVGQINLTLGDDLLPQLKRAATVPRTVFHVTHRLGNGEHRNVEVTTSPAQVDGRTVLFSIVQDITERERTQAELREKQALLEELNQSLTERVDEAVTELRGKDQLLISQSRQAAMGEMIGNIAHQWRQPLNALGLLLANLEDAHRHGELDSASMAAGVAQGNVLVQRMSATIGDFRDFFRPDKERIPFSVKKQIAHTAMLVEASFQQNGVEFCVRAPHDLTLLGLPNEYAQVLLNLLVNANDAIQARGGVGGKIEVLVDTEGGEGVVRVRDNGGGIPPAVLDRIFDPFFSTRESGTGIGLYMSKMIIERSMKGRITALNVPGGAELRVACPLAGSPP